MRSLERVISKQRVRQGKAKESGWGSDDEAAAVPEAEAEETVAATAAPAPKQTARKQVASAFDLLQGSDDEAERAPSEAADGSDAELNGAPLELDSGADSDEGSEGQQVRHCLGACMMQYWQPVHPVFRHSVLQIWLPGLYDPCEHWALGDR